MQGVESTQVSVSSGYEGVQVVNNAYFTSAEVVTPTWSCAGVTSRWVVYLPIVVRDP